MVYSKGARIIGLDIFSISRRRPVWLVLRLFLVLGRASSLLHAQTDLVCLSRSIGYIVFAAGNEWWRQEWRIDTAAISHRSNACVRRERIRHMKDTLA